MTTTRREAKPSEKSEQKRARILEAAERLFVEQGLEGASLRAIAKEAGYTPAALYFHFENKQALYAALLEASLQRLIEATAAAERQAAPEDRLAAAGMAFYQYYAAHPRELDLGFALFRGGLKPHGFGPEADQRLNALLAEALAPIGRAALALGATEAAARRLTAGVFAHLVGVLTLAHTKRVRLFGEAPDHLAEEYLADLRRRLAGR